jgi:hypothetical protein
MNIGTFLGHYQIAENPFQAEEARHDVIFNRIETACHHPDFAKIAGDFNRPSSAIVFGERGSGKTAIRLQIEHLLKQHNQKNVENRCLPLMYDEMNPVLDRFSRHVKKSKPLDTLKEFALVDHIDAMMSAIVPKIVDQVLGDPRGRDGILEIEGSPAKRFRHIDAQAKHDLITLQLHYDRPEAGASRTQRLKRILHYRSKHLSRPYRALAIITGIVALAWIGYFLFRRPTEFIWLWYATIGLLVGFTGIMAVRFATLWWGTHRLAKRLSAKLRVMDRPIATQREMLLSVDTRDFFGAGLPRSNDDDMRYAMFGRLLNVGRPLGYQSILIMIDRVDEPTLINGEPDRMKALIWPLMNNKFLQQDRVSVKMLLPLELRHMLNRESPEFFREARLDKQNLIERLSWSGAVLYDLCTARLNACRAPGANGSTLALRDLFEESVTQQDLIDALDQMQQPRDAFKFVYQLINEHCSNIPEDAAQFKIPRPVLDALRKQQVERMTGMLRGVRPG